MSKYQKGSAIIWVVVAVLVILGIAYWAGSRTTSPDEKAAPVAEIPAGPIKIGAMGPLSGEGAVVGDPMRKTMDMAVEEINAAGGVKGHELQLVWEDSKGDAQGGATATQKLVEIDQLKLIIGAMFSSETLSATAITEPAGVLLLSPSATSPDITNSGDFVFRTYPSDAIGGQVLATYVYTELGKRKAAIISELTDYSQGLRETFKSTFTKLGGEVVADEAYASGDTDFRTQLLKVKAAGADTLYINPQTPVSGNLILKQALENGIDAQIVVNDAMLSNDDIKANASLYASAYSAVPELDNSREVTKRYLDNYQAKYGSAPNFLAYQAAAYDSVYLLAEAISEAGVEPAAVRDWLYQVKDWPGALGDITIDANGDPIIGYNIKHIVNAEIQDLGPYKP